MKNNLGIINAIFLENLSEILKKKNGGKIIKEYASLIRKNKPLMKEYMVYNHIENLKKSENVKEHVMEAISYMDDVNLKDLKLLHEKIYNILESNNIKKDIMLQNKNLYESIESLIFNRKKIKFISENIKNIGLIKEHIENKPQGPEESKEEEIISENIDGLLTIALNNFNEKYESLLTEDEKKVFKEITSSHNKEEKENAFENQRKECLRLTNEYISLTEDVDTKAKLLNVKEKLLEQKFDEKSYMEDMLSLIELKETFNN